jgi:signal recognition particle subunit SRP54
VTSGPATGPDFTFEDFRKQLGQLMWMGLRGDAPAGMPGMSDRITGGEDTEPSLWRIRGMLDEMTKQERDSPHLLDNPQCRRIAAGAGISPQDVERFLGQFQRLRLLLRQMAQLRIWDRV